MAEIGKSCGYARAVRVEDSESLEAALGDADPHLGPHLILVKVGIAPVNDIPRIAHTPTEIRDRFKSSMLLGD